MAWSSSRYDYNTRWHKAWKTEYPKSFPALLCSWILPFCLPKCVHKWPFVSTSGLTADYGAAGQPAACKNVCFSPCPFASHTGNKLFLSMMSWRKKSSFTSEEVLTSFIQSIATTKLYFLCHISMWSYLILPFILFSPFSVRPHVPPPQKWGVPSSFPSGLLVCPFHWMYLNPMCVISSALVSWEQADPGCELQALSGDQCVL